MKFATVHRAAGLAGLAANAWSLRRSSGQQATRAAREKLCSQMGKLHGLPQKLGQMMSFGWGDVEHAHEAFASLQNAAEAMPLTLVSEILKANWRQPFQNVLQEINDAPLAASLGQVHRAVLRDGTEVAIKVQYPEIRHAISTDLKAVNLLAAPLAMVQPGFQTNELRAMLKEKVFEELDYTNEALQQDSFRRWTNKFTGIVIPQTYPELSNERVLVTHWVEGETIFAARQSFTEQQRRELATTLLRMFLHGVFLEGEMQADWHPGNVRFRLNYNRPETVLYDFGCICRLTKTQRLALASLIGATADGGEAQLPWLLALGFSPQLLEPMAAKIPAVCRVLFEPFCVDHPYDLPTWNLRERLTDILGDDRWNFRMAGPPALIFLLRAFHGVAFYLEKLGISLRWQSLFEECIAPLRHELSMLEPPTTVPIANATLARYLKIRVIENGNVKVQVTQPAMCIDHLSNFVDAELRQKIAQRGLSLQEIVVKCRRSAYRPQSVLQIEERGKRIEIWLE